MSLIKKLFSKDRKVKIDFCQKNLDRFVTEEDFSKYSSFLSQKKVEYREFECQSQCEQCKLAPYAMVNGEFVTADNADELLKKLKQFVHA